MTDDIREMALAQQAIRLRVLQFLYKSGGGCAGRPHQVADVAAVVDLDIHGFNQHFRYLKAEDLIGGEATGTCYLTHRGLVEVEATLTQPAKPTEHFGPGVALTLTVGAGAVVGAIMAGSPGGTQTTNINTGGADALAGVLAGLRAAAQDPAIPEADRRVIDSTATLVEATGSDLGLVGKLLGRAKETLDAVGAVPGAVAAAQAIGAYLGAG